MREIGSLLRPFLILCEVVDSVCPGAPGAPGAPVRVRCAIARDRRHLGAEIGFFGILHTWGQNLLHHPHVHYVIAGGGIGPDHDRWVSCRPGFFLPVRVLSALFRKRFLAAIEKLFQQGWAAIRIASRSPTSAC